MFDFSPVQILLVLGIALLVMGPKRLPGMAKSLGHGLRGFRESLAGNDELDDSSDASESVLVTEAVTDDREVVLSQPVQPVATAGVTIAD